MTSENGSPGFSNIVELNVGGVYYVTKLNTLVRFPDSRLGELFSGKVNGQPELDSKGRYFIDRDGVLFRFVLDFLRSGSIALPENFLETERLRQEAEYFRLPEMMSRVTRRLRLSCSEPISTNDADGNSSTLGMEGLSAGMQGISTRESGFVVVGYRGTFQFGRDGLADVKFRKLARILVSGRVSICREVFQDTLNESRDPDRGTSDRYSARFFLKHAFIEQAFDMLQEAGFRMVGSCGAGTNSAGEVKPGMDSEENKWNHYNEFVFCRP